MKKWILFFAFVLSLMMGMAVAEENQPLIFEWEWYQTPQPYEEGKAYIEFAFVEEVPVKLTPAVDWEGVSHYWQILFEYRETNGIDLMVDTFTQVFFGEDHQPHAVFSFEGREECAEMILDATMYGGEAGVYGTRRPVADEIGYGVAIAGVDENGNERTFGFYIPLSHEEGTVYTPEMLLEVRRQAAGEAFLRLIPVENPAPLLIADENFDGGNGWFYGASFLNVSEVAFTPVKLTEIVFCADGSTSMYSIPQEEMVGWGAPETYESGMSWEMTGGMPQQDVLGIGYILSGVDANGNELEFSTYVELEQE